MQHDITGSTYGAGTVSWNAHRPPGSCSNQALLILFLESASSIPTHFWSLRIKQQARLAHTLFMGVVVFVMVLWVLWCGAGCRVRVLLWCLCTLGRRVCASATSFLSCAAVPAGHIMFSPMVLHGVVLCVLSDAPSLQAQSSANKRIHELLRDCSPRA